MRKVYGRGLNFVGQIDRTRKNYAKFQQIKQLQNYNVVNLGCGFLQSSYFLDDGQLIKTGHFFDTLTSSRMLNFYRTFPKLYDSFHYFLTLGKGTISKGSTQDFTLLNKQHILQGVNFTRSVIGHCGVHLFDSKGNMYQIGENYFGQRGSGDTMSNQSQVRRAIWLGVDYQKQHDPQGKTNKKEKKVSDLAMGFQHTVLITDSGQAYGCGKASNCQIQPYKYHYYKDLVTLKQVIAPQLIYGKRKIIKAGCGYKHTILLSENGTLFALGNNKFGQCGINSITNPQVSKLTQIFFPSLENEKIVDLKCGSNHTLILTNKNVYFFGSVLANQNPFNKFNQNVSGPTIINLHSRPVKIFCEFDRSAIITQDGKAYFMGGKDLSKVGGESGKLEINQEFKFGPQSLIGLGFSHTIICP